MFSHLETKINESTNCFDPLQMGQQLFKLINESLSQVWPKEQLRICNINIVCYCQALLATI